MSHQMLIRGFYIALSLFWYASYASAQGLSTEVLSELSELALGETLLSGPLIIDPSGTNLYIGSSFDEPRITQFSIDGSGALTFQRTTLLGNAGSTLAFSGAFAFNNSGSRLYVAGANRVAVLSPNTANGELSLLTELEVSSSLQIRDMELSNDGEHLYIVSNDRADTLVGASAVHTYRVTTNSDELELVDTREETVSTEPLFSVTIPANSDLVFLNRPNALEVHQRNAATGALSLLRRSDGLIASASTGDGLWLFSVGPTRLGVYRLDSQTGEVTQTQEFRSGVAPMLENSLLAASSVALSTDEGRLIVSGSVLVGVVSSGIRSLSSSDVFVRDLASGELRREGEAARVGFEIARHPDTDWFYTFLPSFAGPGAFFPTSAVLAQQGLLPALSETTIISAVLPNSRVDITQGSGVTAFATVLNTGVEDALGCSAGLVRDSTDGLFLRTLQANPTTNEPVAGAPEIFDVVAGGAKQLVLEVRSTNESGIGEAPELLDVRFFCRNSNLTERLVGVTTFALARGDATLPDMLTVTATPDQPGVVSLPSADGQSFFAAATINLAGEAVIRAQPALELAGSVAGADPLEDPPLVRLLICETDPATSLCKTSFASSVERSIQTNEVATYTVLVVGLGEAVPFRPDVNRAFILMQDVNGQMRGGNSVAIETRN